ncbi:MAG: hypothetical protein NC191_08425, partial [Muribaculaceae bacterium]|nr:hypothetical protein [Muribaculaceae bacterium]
MRIIGQITEILRFSQQSNKILYDFNLDCFVATLLAMTAIKSFEKFYLYNSQIFVTYPICYIMKSWQQILIF